jgi:hypothetical protein
MLSDLINNPKMGETAAKEFSKYMEKSMGLVTEFQERKKAGAQLSETEKEFEKSFMTFSLSFMMCTMLRTEDPSNTQPKEEEKC